MCYNKTTGGVMTYKEYVESKTTEELTEELGGLVSAIEVMECFGTRDLIMREEIEAELQKRED